LGETLYFYNAASGELYKKYVDFITGHLIVETAKFSKAEVKKEDVPTVIIDPRIDELYKQVEQLATEIEALKGKPDSKADNKKKGATANDKDNS
jgi:hypothetical protein